METETDAPVTFVGSLDIAIEFLIEIKGLIKTNASPKVFVSIPDLDQKCVNLQ